MTEFQKKKIARYDNALAEARRFVFKAERARVEIVGSEYNHIHQAAAKRASMDLTRALAELRRSLYS
jgi:hypothetical protein